MPHKKILFRLERDSDGFPPVDVEGLWAEELGDGGFVIDNIPFFTRQVALGDLVETQEIDNETFYRLTRVKSKNSLLRVILFNNHDPSMLRSDLAHLGCSTELGHPASLIAVNIPPTTNIADVRQLLDKGSASGFWDYEEPILRQ